jgi:hypothetical protein
MPSIMVGDAVGAAGVMVRDVGSAVPPLPISSDELFLLDFLLDLSDFIDFSDFVDFSDFIDFSDFMLPLGSDPLLGSEPLFGADLLLDFLDFMLPLGSDPFPLLGSDPLPLLGSDPFPPLEFLELEPFTLPLGSDPLPLVLGSDPFPALDFLELIAEPLLLTASGGVGLGLNALPLLPLLTWLADFLDLAMADFVLIPLPLDLVLAVLPPTLFIPLPPLDLVLMVMPVLAEVAVGLLGSCLARFLLS